MNYRERFQRILGRWSQRDNRDVVCRPKNETSGATSEWIPKFVIGDIVKYKDDFGDISNRRFRVSGFRKHLYLLEDIEDGFTQCCRKELEPCLELIGNKMQPITSEPATHNDDLAGQIARAKRECEEKMSDAIKEFQMATGLEVNDLEFKRSLCYMYGEDFKKVSPATINIVVSI